ncbi:thioesterase II family protein [Phytohabitans kaempferiae]|uniref:Thioesterase II family protein n=1 Tax=Phytohabitans kaempferiae TaxID=1620943 RepID=A0ABV6MBA1_9ACTN
MPSYHGFAKTNKAFHLSLKAGAVTIPPLPCGAVDGYIVRAGNMTGAERMSTVAVVFCFPPAGAGASFFHPWRAYSPELRVVPVEMPGREKRFGEPAPDDLREMVDRVLPDLLEDAVAGERVVMFGHSFGAILAYEATRSFMRLRPEADVLLVVSGSPGPRTLRGTTRIADWADDEFIAGVRAISGYHHPALDDPELRDFLLPVLRTDVVMHEGYEPEAGAVVDVPVISIRGETDEVVDIAAAEEWRDWTTKAFHTEELPGGHMYLVDGWPGLLDLIEQEASTVDAAG